MFEFKRLNFYLVFFAVIGSTALLNAGDFDVQEVAVQEAQEGSLIKDSEQCDQEKVEATTTDDEFGLKKKREEVQRNKKKKSKSFDLQDLALAGGGLVVGAVVFGALNNMLSRGDQYFRPTPDSRLLRRGDIFRYVTGVEEDAFGAVDRFTKKDDGFYYINDGVSREFQCGRIFLATVTKCNEVVKRVAKRKNGSFNIIYLNVGPEVSLRYFADVAALQANPLNQDAVFQVASRFNSLENFCVYGRYVNGSLTDFSYKPAWMGRSTPCRGFTPFSDNCRGVQGEEAAFSAAPGGIFRMYGSGCINLLQEIDPESKLFNPFCPVVPGGFAIDQNLGLFRKDGWQNNLMICFHEGIEVVAGLEIYNGSSWSSRADNYSELAQPRQIIHQVPVSAFNFINDNQGNRVSKDATMVATQLLNATYRGTLLAAVARGKRKIFLTMVGGGVFYNKFEWISEAIYNCQDLIKDYGLQVYLVAWGNKDLNSWIDSGCQKLQCMASQILYLSGNSFELRDNASKSVEYQCNVTDQNAFNDANVNFEAFLRNKF